MDDQSASGDVNNELEEEVKEKLKEIKRLQETIDTQKAQFETQIQEISSKKDTDLRNLQLQLNEELTIGRNKVILRDNLEQYEPETTVQRIIRPSASSATKQQQV